ncbi:hypothetical protein SAMN05216263_10599 [Metapseudomonas otitidis]|nr:hypothetical protein SAMN05216263_10599 [Pseudomonas otitidis]
MPGVGWMAFFPSTIRRRARHTGGSMRRNPPDPALPLPPDRSAISHAVTALPPSGCAHSLRPRRLRNAYSPSGLTAPESSAAFLCMRHTRARSKPLYVGSGLIQDPKGEYVRPSRWGFLTPDANSPEKAVRPSRGNGHARFTLAPRRDPHPHPVHPPPPPAPRTAAGRRALVRPQRPGAADQPRPARRTRAPEPGPGPTAARLGARQQGRI